MGGIEPSTEQRGATGMGTKVTMGTKGAKGTPRLVLAVINQKGGVGKTTLSINIAAAAHLEGHRTLILDMDVQGSALDWSSAREEGSRLDGIAVAKADRALTLPRFRELWSGFDVVVIDGPPRLGDVTRSAAVAADVALIPLRVGVFDYWACSETTGALDSADGIRAELGRPPIRRLFCMNGFDGRTKAARAALDAIAAHGEMAQTTVGNRIAFAEASAAGESVLTVAPDSAAASEVMALWSSVRPAEEARAHV
jgi:chromosome partitioning protein